MRHVARSRYGLRCLENHRDGAGGLDPGAHRKVPNMANCGDSSMHRDRRFGVEISCAILTAR